MQHLTVITFIDAWLNQEPLSRSGKSKWQYKTIIGQSIKICVVCMRNESTTLTQQFLSNQWTSDKFADMYNSKYQNGILFAPCLCQLQFYFTYTWGQHLHQIYIPKRSMTASIRPESNPTEFQNSTWYVPFYATSILTVWGQIAWAQYELQVKRGLRCLSEPWRL